MICKSRLISYFSVVIGTQPAQLFQFTFFVVEPLVAPLAFPAVVLYSSIEDTAQPGTVLNLSSSSGTPSLIILQQNHTLPANRVLLNTSTLDVTLSPSGNLLLAGVSLLATNATYIQVSFNASIFGYTFVTSCTVIVRLVRTPTGPPTFTQPSFNFSVSGDLAIGSLLGRIEATDSKRLPVRFEFVGNQSLPFLLGADSGLIVLRNAINESFDVSVTASNSRYSSTTTITITYVPPVDPCLGIVCTDPCFQDGTCLLGRCVFDTMKPANESPPSCYSKLCNCSADTESGVSWYCDSSSLSLSPPAIPPPPLPPFLSPLPSRLSSPSPPAFPSPSPPAFPPPPLPLFLFLFLFFHLNDLIVF
jgi:hypothetical protein